MEQRFYKQGGRWYIDLPLYLEKVGTDISDLEMVAGADDLLDELTEGLDDEITVKLSEELNMNDWPLVILAKRPIKDVQGQTYSVIVDAASKINVREVWLCDVTPFIFNNKFPDTIYIYTK